MRQKLMCAFLLILAYGMLGGNAYSQQTPLVQPKPPKGLDYSYSYTKNFFKADESVAFMDDYLVSLKVRARQAGKKDVYISLFDLERIYAPDFKVSNDGKSFSVEHVGITAKGALDDKAIQVSGLAASLPDAPRLIDGEICVPVASFMSIAFAKDTRVEQDFVIVGHNQDKLKEFGPGARDIFGLLNHKLRGKTFGFVYRTYWFEEGKRTMSYRMYVPTTYDPKVPNKMILLVHGASVNQDYFFPDTHEFVRYYKPIEEYAEKYGYILAAPNAYVKNSWYGDNKPVMDQPSIQKLSDDQMKLRVLSEKGFMLGFEDVLKHYNIDKKKIFMFGQSMGSVGALFLGNKYPENFKAIVCTGLLPNLTVLNGNPYPNLINMPVLFGYGTEDFSGFDLAQKNSQILASYLKNFKTHWDAGGHHSNAWAKSLEQIFDFLNGQLK
jgi:predicted esterase